MKQMPPNILRSVDSSASPARTRLVEHPKVLEVVALSGGYSREEANARAARSPGVVASLSLALTENLFAHQSDDVFDAALDPGNQSIHEASVA